MNEGVRVCLPWWSEDKGKHPGTLSISPPTKNNTTALSGLKTPYNKSNATEQLCNSCPSKENLDTGQCQFPFFKTTEVNIKKKESIK